MLYIFKKYGGKIYEGDYGKGKKFKGRIIGLVWLYLSKNNIKRGFVKYMRYILMFIINF